MAVIGVTNMLGITDKRRINSIPFALYIFFTATIVGEVRFSSIQGTKCSRSGTVALFVLLQTKSSRLKDPKVVLNKRWGKYLSTAAI